MKSKKKTKQILISDQSHGLPYSKGLMASSLMVSGLPPNEAFRIAAKIEDTLRERGVSEINRTELRNIAASMLGEAGETYASTYLKWQAVEELEIPFIILIGGATGVGKSTAATQLATRLGINRVISTDAVREVLRSAFSRELMPTLHESSFEADTSLRVPLPARSDPVIIGFREQVAAVAVGIKALIARAIEEGTDMIIEGAHVVPGFLEGWETEFKDAVLVPLVIAVSDETLHRSHFHLRSLDARHRPWERYLQALPKIRLIQNYIKDLAVRHNVPVVEAFDLDTTLQKIVTLVLEKALESAKLRGEKPDVDVPDKEQVLEQVGGDGNGSSAAATNSPDRKVRVKGMQMLGGRRKSQ